MRILVIEPSGQGHHMALHARLLLTEARRRGWETHLMTTSEAREHPSFTALESALEKRLHVHLMDHVSHPGPHAGRLSLARFQWASWRAFRKGVKRLPLGARPDVVYLVNLDYCHFPIALLGSPFESIPFAGMLMGLRFHLSRAGLSRRRRLWRATQELVLRRLLTIPELRAITTVDPVLQAYMQENSIGRSDKLRYVPDPALPVPEYERTRARDVLRLPSDSVTVLAFGRLTARKALDSLLQALQKGAGGDGLQALLAGEPDAAVSRLLGESVACELARRGRLKVIDRFLQDEEVGLVFSAADAVWLAYRDFEGMSGVLAQAARHGLPVIGSSSGVIGWLTARYDLGPVVDPDDPASVHEALLSLCRDRQSRSRWASNAQSLGREHAPEQFGRALCAEIASRVDGLESDRSSPS